MGLTVVAAALFLDRIFLRIGLNMVQFGVIKGIIFLIPMTINLLVSPYVLRLQPDHIMARRERRRKVPRVEMIVDMYRALRSFISRDRP